MLCFNSYVSLPTLVSCFNVSVYIKGNVVVSDNVSTVLLYRVSVLYSEGRHSPSVYFFFLFKHRALHAPLKVYVCRSSLINSPVETLSTENVINWITPETTRDPSENSIEVIFLSSITNCLSKIFSYSAGSLFLLNCSNCWICICSHMIDFLKDGCFCSMLEFSAYGYMALVLCVPYMRLRIVDVYTCFLFI